MLEIAFFCILSSVSFFSAGQILNSKVIYHSINKKNNFAVNIVFGILILGFIGILINFFIPLNLYINSFIFFLLLIYFIYYISNNKNEIKPLILDIFFISIITSLSIYLSNINRPDAGLYHLPFSKLLNDSKIIFGASNIHFRFGHTSIIQYSNAINFNFLFKEKGILIPQGLIIISMLYYFGKKIFLKIQSKKINIDLFFLLIFFSFSIINYNRYSSFGNDAGGNILFIFLLYKSLSLIPKKNVNINDIILLTFISLFCFTQKSFLIFSFLIPFFLFLVFQKKNYLSIIKSKQILLLVILTLTFFIKNIIISGCLIYPSTITCIKNLSWYNHVTTSKEELMAEAWAKDWVNSNKKLTPTDYKENFNWINTWSDHHLKVILKKLSQYLPILLLVLLFLIILTKKNKKKGNHKFDIKILSILLFTCLVSLFIWFIKFPLYRYGSGIIGGSIIMLFIVIFYKKILIINSTKFIQLFKFIFIALIVSVFLKNFIKIKDKINVKYNHYPWPKIYSLTNELNEINYSNYKSHTKEGKFILYLAKDGYCMFGPSPCSYYVEKNLNKKKIFDYEIFYIDK